MGKLTTVSGLRAVLLLLAVLNSAVADKIYFKSGGGVTLQLRPPVTERITNILWKHNGNLLAEWVDEKVDLTYYGTFHGRTTLDTTTGRLEIKTMTGADAGQFTVEINSKVQAQSFEAEAIKEVPRPEVLVRPLTCSSGSDSCTLTCEGDTGKAGPVTYSWKEGDGAWKQSGKDLNIIKNEAAHVETFSCRMENPVSGEESKPEPNPFLKTEEPDNPVVGIVFGVLVGLGLVVVGGLAFWKREIIREKFCECIGSRSADSAAGNGQPSLATVETHSEAPGAPGAPRAPRAPGEDMPLTSKEEIPDADDAP